MDRLAAILPDWLAPAVHVPPAALVAAAAQLAFIAVAWLLAALLRRLTAARTDALIERVDPRLRNPRIMRALRPLAVLAIWWALLLLASRFGLVLGYDTRLLHVAASLVLAWIVIRATTALVRDPFLSHAAAVLVWLAVALDLLGLMPATAAALDSLALTIGTLRLSLLAVIKAALLLAVLLWAASALARVVQLRVSRIASLTPSIQVLIANLLRIGLTVLAVIVALNAVGIDLTALAVFSGAVGVGVGLGLQKSSRT